MKYSQKIVQCWYDLEAKFIPPKAWESDLLTLWRERITFILFFLAVVLGPFALIPSLILSYNEGLWGVFILDSAAYLITLVVFFSKKFSLKHKTWIYGGPQKTNNVLSSKSTQQKGVDNEQEKKTIQFGI